MPQEFFYRVEESRYTEENGHKDVFIRAFPVIKTTLKGVWLNTAKWGEECPKKFQKFVLRDGGKFAQPTKERAFAEFKRRKDVHIQMMQFRLNVIKKVLSRAELDGASVIINMAKVDELTTQFRRATDDVT